jgi:hypothetical protein
MPADSMSGTVCVLGQQRVLAGFDPSAAGFDRLDRELRFH